MKNWPRWKLTLIALACGISGVAVLLLNDGLESQNGIEYIGFGSIVAITLTVIGLSLLVQSIFSNSKHRLIPIRYSLAIVIIFVVFTRVFFLEFTKVASNSMLPTLAYGDYVLIKKYNFGIKIPLIQKKLFSGKRPKRGELVVFEGLTHPTKYYIKRIIGLPGDHITYEQNRLKINNTDVTSFADGKLRYLDPDAGYIQVNRYKESLDRSVYQILDGPLSMHAKDSEWRVPAEHYFVLGDNRDDSQDSRFIGSIPYVMLVGTPVKFLASFYH